VREKWPKNINKGFFGEKNHLKLPNSEVLKKLPDFCLGL
jgi:hypothetical protein